MWISCSLIKINYLVPTSLYGIRSYEIVASGSIVLIVQRNVSCHLLLPQRSWKAKMILQNHFYYFGLHLHLCYFESHLHPVFIYEI